MLNKKINGKKQYQKLHKLELEYAQLIENKANHVNIVNNVNNNNNSNNNINPLKRPREYECKLNFGINIYKNLLNKKKYQEIFKKNKK